MNKVISIVGEYVILIAIVLGAVYLYDDYNKSKPYYVIDVQKVFENQKKDFDITSSEEEIMQYYANLEKGVDRYNIIVKQISKNRNITIYDKNVIISTDKVIVDLTSEVLNILTKEGY